MLLLYVARRRVMVNVIVVCCQTEGDGECYCCMLPDGG